MPTLTLPIEKPRKLPVQERSTFTVESILDAVIQVLIAEGKDRLTTTRVAARAGVSVGTLYQYFPNKQSLLQATLRRKLSSVTEAVEQACAAHHGEPVCTMLTHVVEAFFKAKMRNPTASRALYAISSDVGGLRISEELRHRWGAALGAAIESSPDRLSVSTASAVFVLGAAMTGVSRSLLESLTPVLDPAEVQRELLTMVCGYIDAVRVRSAV